MSNQYKEVRLCECGYQTIQRSNWSIHKKICKSIPDAKDARIATLEKQLEDTKEQLAAKDQLLNEQREDLRMIEKLLAERFTELQDEVKQLRKRKKQPELTDQNRSDVKSPRGRTGSVQVLLVI